MTNLDLAVKDISGKFVTVDCNVLLLLIIGSIGKEHIIRFKRTNMFTEDDFDLLIRLIKNSKIIVTPNVLTEASNLLESYNSSFPDKVFITLKTFINSFKEDYSPSIQLSSNESFFKFGLSDSSIHELSKKGVVAITVDFPLAGYLASNNCPVINFNHMRVEL